jgi:hypothetical protein
MAKISIPLIVMFALTLSTFPVSMTDQATTAVYYVATSGSNDSGDSSSTNPWATITHALDNVSDGSTILVRPGTYSGRVRLRGQFTQSVIVRSELPYPARLRNDSTVTTCFYGQGITLEGFDIAHSGPGSAALVIQIQDLLDDPNRTIADPYLREQGDITMPRWEPNLGYFADGSARIREAYQRLVILYGRPSIHSPLLDIANPAHSPAEDILGNSRSAGSGPDIGAYEVQCIGDVLLYLPAIFQ